MDGSSVILTATGINAIALGVVVFAIKKIINSCINGFEKRLNIERDDRIKIDNTLWQAVNTHGHKGLNGENAKVTR